MKRFKQAKDIKVGVIGYGGAFNMGQLHLKDMTAAGMTPVAVAELDPARLEIAKANHPGIQTYRSVTAMLKKSDVNLVTLITPHNSHARLAVQCLNAGKGVVVEKPMAITTAECDAMIAAAKKNKVVLSAFHNRHWDGCIMNAVKKISSGAVGDVIRIEAHAGGYQKPRDWWRSSKSISGGILYDWGVHFLEYSLQLIHSDIAEVIGVAKRGFWADKTPWKADTTEDEALALVRFANGAWLTLCITTIDSNPKRGQLEITGTKGTYIFAGDWWEIITRRGGRTVTTRGQNPPSQWPRYYKNIADHLTTGEKLVITAEWARRPIHILDLACKSAAKGVSMKARYA